jgi:hypothetical protein
MLSEHFPNEAFIPEVYAYVFTTLDGRMKESAKVLGEMSNSKGVSVDLRVACQDGCVAIKTILKRMEEESSRMRRGNIITRARNFLRRGKFSG